MPRTAAWPVTLRHGPVTLRPMRVRDEDVWSEIRRRGFAWFSPWDSTRPPDSAEQPMSFAQTVRTFAARARRGMMLPWAVEYRPEPSAKPVFAGQVTVSGIAYGSACWGQFGYWIDPQWAGRGIIPLAVAMAADHCFDTLGLHRLEAAILPENQKSRAVVTKLGFRDEGLRPRYMYIRGAWRDHEMFVLLAEDMPEGVVARYENRGRSADTPGEVGPSGRHFS